MYICIQAHVQAHVFCLGFQASASIEGNLNILLFNIFLVYPLNKITVEVQVKYGNPAKYICNRKRGKVFWSTRTFWQPCPRLLFNCSHQCNQSSSKPVTKGFSLAGMTAVSIFKATNPGPVQSRYVQKDAVRQA